MTGVQTCALPIYDITIDNNVLYNERKIVHGVDLGALPVKNLLVKYSRNVLVYGNTFADSYSIVQDSADGTVRLKNNVFQNELLSVEDPADVGPGELDHNVYNKATDAIAWGGTFYPSRAAFHAAVPAMETFGKDGDPKLNAFPSPSLQPGSAAIDMGADLGSPYSTDINGTSRPQGTAWDAGAYESPFSVGDKTPPAAPRRFRLQ